MDKYKSYGTLSKTIHFLSVFCEVDVVQQCTVVQAGMVQDGLKVKKSKPLLLLLLVFFPAEHAGTDLSTIYTWGKNNDNNKKECPNCKFMDTCDLLNLVSTLESTLCAELLFGVRSTPVLLQWHVKDPGHSAKSAGGRLHLNTHTPMTQRSRCGLIMLLSRHSVGTYQETSSHATCQGTLDHSRLSSLSHCGLILA